MGRLTRYPRLTGFLDDQAPIAVWTDLEISVGIICACLPACRSLVGYLFPNLKMTLGSSGPSLPSAYQPKNTYGNGSKSRPVANTKSFIELDDRSQDTLEEGRGRRGTREMLNGHGNDSLEYGHSATIEVGDGTRQARGKRGNTIVMTTTLDQSERRL